MMRAAMWIAVLTVVVSVSGEECTDCAMSAYVNDPDPNGLNVRDAPKGTVIGRIPFQHAGTILTVDCAEKGWLHFSEASVIEEDDSPVEEPAQEGWVYGKLMRVDPSEGAPDARIPLYSAPDTSSERVTDLEISAMDVRILGCRGAWVRVEIEYHEGGEEFRGWLREGDYCDSPVTTCP
jgi:hypothetical protein